MSSPTSLVWKTPFNPGFHTGLLTEREQTCMDKTCTASTGARESRCDDDIVGDFGGDIKKCTSLPVQCRSASGMSTPYPKGVAKYVPLVVQIGILAVDLVKDFLIATSLLLPLVSLLAVTYRFVLSTEDGCESYCQRKRLPGCARGTFLLE